MIKVWWHCLIRTLSKEEHRMVKREFLLYGKIHLVTTWECACGYNHKELF